MKSQINTPEINTKYDNARLIRALYPEIIKYSESVISKYLNAIYFFDSLTIKGTSIGGTYDIEFKSIYFPNRNGFNNKKYTRYFFKNAFHHEFSSILMRSNNFSEDDWRFANGESFQYEGDKDPTFSWMFLNGYVDPVDKNILYNRGLLNHYSETGVENDFNTYAELIFVNPKKMKKLIKKYPVIQRKYEVFREFYLSIDVGFAPVFDKIDG